ncbi:tyrosine-protein kinase ZAP-70-like [Xenia sp. Carnegie-2017]|uniref:tyrosine-protein kinase ZAP-70-like n=1 Tax=Xenia sp. Carnegie-2017 TaxID=2897299 RepID=UPI001F033EC5|nr:tyrosine-protein kinase ZAP-70-like [Xenia sp. Carnegie-2017]
MDDPVRQPYFYGRISRLDAERYLRECGMEDGMFLLRKRPTEAQSFALSLCYQNSVYHYYIQHHTNGKYGIEDGPSFLSPVELIDYHRANQGGLLTTLTKPCNRPEGVEPKVYTNVDYSEVEEATNAAMSKLGIGDRSSLGKNHIPLEVMLGMLLHAKQSWFHGVISRQEAETRLKKCGGTDGLFLVRERERTLGTFAIGLCFQHVVYHYLLNADSHGKLSIPSGPQFLNLMECVEYYLNRSDGLVCKLGKACPVGEFEKNGALPSLPSGPRPEAIYDTVAMKKSSVYHNAFKDIQELDFSRLTLENTLGQGHFGSVLKGVYKLSNGKKIEVAVKQLKTTAAAQQTEIEHEARIMLKLDHPHIVRMIGICKEATMMLVMELAGNGPLHKFLRKNKQQVTVRQILVLMLQVSEGMEYLDSKHFVHRDLAARNVLVVDVNFVKISDFGMSRAMGVGNNYYRAEAAGKWPLKWYAPECIYYYKFSTKSDVWAYGITVWEALMHGSKPYEGYNGQQVIQFLEMGERLHRPEKCPQSVYSLMRGCWEWDPEKRPDFSLVKETLSNIIFYYMK